MSGKRILLIEDDRAIGRVLRDNLQYDGFSVEWSQTGRGVDVTAKRFNPDLVLLDLSLPEGIDGLDLCRYFNQQPERTPVIIITARSSKEERVRGLTLGADDYVVKPFALEELLARVHEKERSRLRCGSSAGTHSVANFGWQRLGAVRQRSCWFGQGFEWRRAPGCDR